ncbi:MULTISPECIES: S1C family serine protease [unclassified Enterococcus]|uniref:S1C family serine protease n=1 Tax=unclassified Enterococcus TaxID=2608891 RepID=UPI0006B984BA|nr:MULTISPECIES: trypsin-like peptidase domain-containing protein [unclassified Enterococcus]KPG70067.1 serine protease [Enterococcus sp. RIT-PI-f]
MARKDVTPEKKPSSGLLKKLGIGILGGVVGGLLTFGGLYLAMGTSLTNSNSSTTTTGVQNSSGETTVSNVKLDVTSDVTEAVEKVQGAVVSIINLQQSQTSDFGSIFGQQSGQDGQTEDNTSDDSTLEAASEGSGVIYKVDGDTAYVVTNNHVVEGQSGLEVVLSDGTKVTGELVGTDAYTDLAVIKIASDKVETVATFGDSSALKVGEPAIAIGSPLGSDYANSVTQGIISSLNRQVTSQNDSGETVSINAIQTDAAINPGNSGGPLINVDGQVVGINSSKIASTSESTSSVSVEGMGFAIPSNDVVEIINQLESDGKVVRPALGIRTIDLSSITSQQQEQILKVPSSVTAGVVVYSVNNATPAEQAGLQQYDVITKVDDTEISSTTDLQSALYKHKVGDTITLTFYRGDEEKTATVELSVDTSINDTTESSN